MIELRRLSGDEPQTRTAIDHLERLASSKLDDLQRSIQAAQAGKPHTAVANIAAGTGKRLMEAFQRDSAELEDIQRQLLEERRRQEQQARFFSQAVLVTTVVFVPAAGGRRRHDQPPLR